MTRKYPRRAQIVAIHEEMKRVLKKEDGTGLWFYTGGISDQSLAAGYEVSEASVRNLRIECFGKLREVSPPSNEQLLAKRVIELEHRVKTYEECITDMALRIAKLEKEWFGEGNKGKAA